MYIPCPLGSGKVPLTSDLGRIFVEYTMGAVVHMMEFNHR